MSEEALSVFLSYSHRDLELLEQLNTHLAGLKRTNKIKTWHDRDVEAGIEWEPEIQKKLDTADIIILLISANFIASDYCYSNELERAIERHNAGEARVIPILLKSCVWNLSGIPFSKLNVLPDYARPVAQWEDQDEAFANIAQKISEVVESLRESKIELLRSQPQIDKQEQQPTNSSYRSPTPLRLDEATIQEIRERCRQKIMRQHNRMRLLSGQEVEVDQIYVDVWLLEKPEHKHFKTPENLLSCFDINKDRLALSKRIQRSSGFDVANRKSKLIILGKPGSGKTTFLKHLAVDWCKGKFQPTFIALLFELRSIQYQKWDIWSIIGQELGLDDWHEFTEVKKEIDSIRQGFELNSESKKAKSSSRVKDLEKQLENFHLYHLLTQGRLLILMDGLDEITKNESRLGIQDQIRKLMQSYPENRLILTCRTQIIGDIPGNFTSVEVADFSEKQIRSFVRNWFMVNDPNQSQGNKKWEIVRQAIVNQPDLKELTSTPVLLNLVCLVLQDQGEIPTDRVWLYKKGIKLLLSRWNEEKLIEGWEVGTETYRQLSPHDKETLLIGIAARKFENPKNFVLFEQDELATQIAQKLNLANTREGVAVLKSIEAQHGLLVERADELWSFSHLTFQEYFTVQWLTQLPPQLLANKIANQQWQKVLNQLIRSQQPADRLILLIKQAIDQSIRRELAIQSNLTWLLKKSEVILNSFKSVTVRALYFSFSRPLDLNLDLARAIDSNRNRDEDIHLYLISNLALDPTLAFDQILEPGFAYDLKYKEVITLALDFNLVRTLDRAQALNIDIDFDLAQAYD